MKESEKINLIDRYCSLVVHASDALGSICCDNCHLSNICLYVNGNFNDNPEALDDALYVISTKVMKKQSMLNKFLNFFKKILKTY